MTCHDMGAPRMFRDAAVGLGNFDGLHLGHMALIHRLSALAARRGLTPIVYMFREHPQNVLRGEGTAKLLTDNDAKCGILGRTAIECVCFDRFDAAFARTAPDEFARRVLRGRLDARLVVAGFDYRFGAANAADASDLERLGPRCGFDVHIVEPYEAGGAVVGSSAIRALLEAGSVGRAREMLGRLFSVRGAVVGGMRVGRTIGLPTANLLVGPGMLVPREGVYATSALVGGRYRDAVTSVGASPTVGGNPLGAVETHVIGFSGDLYGSTLEVRFHERIRDMEKFSSINALRERIRQDIEAARAYFARR